MNTPQPHGPHHPMMRWYDPGQLIRTAGSVFVSTLFGRFSDHRLMEALATGEATCENFSDRDEVIIDYAADVGDGWDPTYAVAYWLSRPTLTLQGEDKRRYELRRGDMLLFGGDQVYPTPSRLRYKEKLIGPYKAAMENSHPPHPLVFALPGNHDWYDSLVSFTRLFCRTPGAPTKWFAGWQTSQTRSYFAIKLPGRWWLAAIDVQLASNIDEPQVAYFRGIAKQMSADARVIVCTAEPDWIYSKWWGTLAPDYSDDNSRFVADKLFDGKVRVFLAGDLHHYRRHESPDKRQKITAGGGGAFLHPTHGADSQVLADNFVCKKAFPDPARSRRLAWGNLRFIVNNPTFGLATGVAYLLVAWVLMSGVSRTDLTSGRGAAVVLFEGLVVSPAALFVVASVFLGFWLFTDTHSKKYRMYAGTVHAASHLMTAITLGWQSFALAAGWFQTESALRLVSGVIVFALGAVTGPIILGVYLLISLSVFGRHTTEAFSSLHIPDWKNFLRIVVRRDGQLTIYPIGIERVPRKWKAVDSEGYTPTFVPDDSRATDPALIERPIVL